ncbi:hypothetical protein ACFWPH_00645 [Nocardia sp. NPDC058499]|uniref:hypothetical protein n=1 Tax=Nocardia sp. NPDC058499 TaxID=3346530 RepID=UPI003660995D
MDRYKHGEAAGSGAAATRLTRASGQALGDLLATSTRDVVDHFAACPHCGYSVEASETLMRFSKGHVQRTLFRTCGLPCGWDETTVEVAATVSSTMTGPAAGSTTPELVSVDHSLLR